MRRLLWLVLGGLCLPALDAGAKLEWRVWVKFILDAGGNRPSGGIIDTDQDVRDQIDAANTLIDPFGRGYRFRLTEIVPLSGFSSLFATDRDTTSTTLKDLANSDPNSVAWRTNAINVYINADPGANEGITVANLIVLGHQVTRQAFT